MTAFGSRSVQCQDMLRAGAAKSPLPDNGRMEGQRMAAYSPDALDPRRCAGWLLWGDCVEKGGIGRGIISHHDSWGAVDDGEAASPARRVVLRVFARTSCANGASAAIDRPV